MKTILVLSNSFGPIAVFDDWALADKVLESVADNEDQQNNSIEEFVLNEQPDISLLVG